MPSTPNRRTRRRRSRTEVPDRRTTPPRFDPTVDRFPSVTRWTRQVTLRDATHSDGMAIAKESTRCANRSGVAHVTWIMRTRTILSFIAMLAGTAAGTLPAVASAAGPSPYGDQPINWQTVLVAGDNSVAAFDNGITALHQSSGDRGVDECRRAAGLRRTGNRGEHRAGDRRHPGPAGRRMPRVHDQPRVGSRILSRQRRPRTGLLSPDELTGMLDRGCGRAPTVLIVSACHSGTFLTEAMTQPNRVVITAARTDRTSFGCSDEYQYTFFDECVLGALPGAADWGTLYNDVTSCVNDKEAQLGATRRSPSSSRATRSARSGCRRRRPAADAASRPRRALDRRRLTGVTGHRLAGRRPAGTRVPGDPLRGARHSDAFGHSDDQVSFSTNASSWRRLRHS